MQAALFRRATEEPLSVSDLVREREIKRRELQAGTIAVPHLDYARKSRNVGIPASFPIEATTSALQRRVCNPEALLDLSQAGEELRYTLQVQTPTLEESVSRLKQLMNRPYPPIRGSVKNDPINRECPNHRGA